MEYKTRIVQSLALLQQQYDGKLAEEEGAWGMLYLAVRSEIPKLLLVIDENEEIRSRIEGFLKELLGVLNDTPPEHG